MKDLQAKLMASIIEEAEKEAIEAQKAFPSTNNPDSAQGGTPLSTVPAEAVAPHADAGLPAAADVLNAPHFGDQFPTEPEYQSDTSVKSGEAATDPIMTTDPIVTTDTIVTKDTHEELIAAQKHRSSDCGIAPKDGGHLTCPGEFQKYADQSSAWADFTNYAYPIFDKAHADDAASRWDDPGAQDKYSTEEKSLIAARIKKAQDSFGEASKNLDVNAALLKQNELLVAQLDKVTKMVEALTAQAGSETPADEPVVTRIALDAAKGITVTDIDGVKTLEISASADPELVKSIVAALSPEAPVEASAPAPVEHIDTEGEKKVSDGGVALVDRITEATKVLDARVAKLQEIEASLRETEAKAQAAITKAATTPVNPLKSGESAPPPEQKKDFHQSHGSLLAQMGDLVVRDMN